MKRVISLLLGAFLCMTVSCSKNNAPKYKFDASKAIKDTGSVSMNDIPSTEVTKLMGSGWNLGNTMDAYGVKGLESETCWGMPKTTKKMIDGLASSGFKTIRIPVSWSGHIIDNSYTIDPVWMNRVKEIVDWAISDGMYVILNCHHDNYLSADGLVAPNGYYPNEKYYEVSEDFVTNVWAQIATAFNNGYDEHLIFETMNEPRLAGTNIEWSFNSKDPVSVESAEVINKLNAAIVSTIRATGGNNKTRFIMIPGYVASPEAALSDKFKLPEDEAENKLIVSVHMYTPYIFAGQTPGTKTFTIQIQSEFASKFKQLNQKFVKNGVGVVIGEYGAVNKNNPEDREKWFRAFIKFSHMNNIPAVLWDNGQWEVPAGTMDYNEKFGYYNRKDATWYFPEITKAIIEEVNQ